MEEKSLEGVCSFGSLWEVVRGGVFPLGSR